MDTSKAIDNQTRLQQRNLIIQQHNLMISETIFNSNNK